MFLLKCVTVFAIFVANASDPLLVTLPNGQIRGHELKTFTNRTYHGYQSIPFATPPLGELRFQAPQPSQNWSGILNATKDSNICYQYGSDGPEEGEDCLYINVFTPVVNREANDSKLPVLFWIHGGGLINGATSYQSFRPDYWMDEDIILVTHNYRLGAFGFLSTGDSVIPGNNGLRDQTLALKWTYENIHLFGGDGEKITVQGMSSGAVASSYHLLIKQSAGLFRSVIAQSGTPLIMGSFKENPREHALQLVQAINPNISSNVTSEEIRDFLMSLEGKTIDYYSPLVTSVPAVVLEPKSPSAVVAKEMYEQFDSGNFFRVPVLMGICSEEALFLMKSHKHLKELGASYDADSSLVVPYIFPHDEKFDRKTIGKAIKAIYLNETQTWATHPGRVVQHLSDQRVSRPTIKQGKLISQYAPMYLYQFSYDGKIGGFNPTFEVLDAEKVVHAEDLHYIFLDRSLREISASEDLTHKRLMRLLSNFIKFQNPTPYPDELLDNVIWPKASPDDYKFLNINHSLSIETNPRAGFFSKWENIFETYGSRPFSTY